MNRLYFFEIYKTPIVAALGFFDCVHVGHAKLIEEAKRLASKLNAESAVLTFANDPNPNLLKKQQIYTLDERAYVLHHMGVDNLIFAYFNDEFANLSPTEFLDKLTRNFDLKAVVVGKDYTFGNGAEGDAAFLERYLTEKGIQVKILPFEKMYAKKVSTTAIKKFVDTGDLPSLNSSLSQNYFLLGTIVHAHQRGRILGYPTANLSVHGDCIKLASGIYATKMYFDNKVYCGVTNVGEKPTFGESDYSIETYLIDFVGDIYGKFVRLEFFKRIRGVIKFNSIPALVKQLERDRDSVIEFFDLKGENNKNKPKSY